MGNACCPNNFQAPEPEPRDPPPRDMAVDAISPPLRTLPQEWFRPLVETALLWRCKERCRHRVPCMRLPHARHAGDLRSAPDCSWKRWRRRPNTLRACYPDGDPARFGEGSIYNDAKAHPEKDLRAMIVLAAFRERNHVRAFQPLPLRTEWVPASMLIGNRIAAHHLLGWTRRSTTDEKNEVWRRLVSRKRRIFKEQ